MAEGMKPVQEALAQADSMHAAEIAEKQLRGEWGADYDYKLGRAHAAYRRLTGQSAEAAPVHIGNDSDTIRALADAPTPAEAEIESKAKALRDELQGLQGALAHQRRLVIHTQLDGLTNRLIELRKRKG